MAYTPIQTTGLLGVNVTGNEPPDAITGVPRVAPLTTVQLSGSRRGIFVLSKAALNPGTTCVLDTTSADGRGTVSSTTSSGQMITLNATACTCGDYIWARLIETYGATLMG